MALIINIITGLAYLGLAGFFAFRLKNSQQALPSWNKLLPFIPMALHLYSLYLAIETGNGQDLSLFNLLSLIAFIMVSIVAFYRFRHQTPHLMLYIAVFAAVSLFITIIPHKQVILSLKGETLGLIHIWLAIISFSLLLMAAIQSGLVLMLNKKLRSNPAGIHPLLPPLLQMERFAFDLVIVGIVALTVALGVGFFLPESIIKQQALHKIILTLIAWFSFCTLIFSYKLSKISGIQFSRYTLIAFSLLATGFIGTKFVLEFIIQKG